MVYGIKKYGRGRSKKLIAAVHVYYGTTLTRVYACEGCTSKQKRARGCKKPRKKQVWQIDECIFCNGKNKNCLYCKGRGRISVYQCPRTISDDYGLIPYFNAYRNSEGLAWPDGRGRLYQPVKLVTAFDILGFYFNKFEPKPEVK